MATMSSKASLARLSWLANEPEAKLLVSGQFRGVGVYYPTALAG
jgi:hypothetical protein